MIINFTPIVAHREESDYYLYHSEGDILYVTKGDITEEFDFTNFPNGVAQDIISDYFDPAPVKEAKRVDDILYVTVERTLPETASAELTFPKPVDTTSVALDTVENDPLYEELFTSEEEPIEPEFPQEEEPIEGPSETEGEEEDEEEELGDPEVIKLTEHEYSKEENIDYEPIVDEVFAEYELEPVPDIPVPEPVEPDDDLLKTPEFTDVESALEQAYLEEEERKLQEELARQRELEDKLMEEQIEQMENGVGTPEEEETPTREQPSEDPVEPPHSDEVAPSKVLEVDEYDYASEGEKALEDITEGNSEVYNNG